MRTSSNENPNLKTSLAQTGEILRALQSGERLTPLDALNRFGCLRLGARIWDLKRQGFSIKSRMIKTSNGKRVSEYSLSNS